MQLLGEKDIGCPFIRLDNLGESELGLRQHRLTVRRVERPKSAGGVRDSETGWNTVFIKASKINGGCLRVDRSGLCLSNRRR